MSVLLFILILVALVIGHECGHFIMAKLSGMRVPEFGIGFPPKLWGKKIGTTEYTVNALPFGGFVKIDGEDPSQEPGRGVGDAEMFYNRPTYLQALTLFAGPFANLLIALLLSSLAFISGVPAALNSGYDDSYIKDPHVLVVGVLAGSPSDNADIKDGDSVVSLTVNGHAHRVGRPEDIAPLIQNAEGEVGLVLMRQGKLISISLSPIQGLVAEDPARKALGIATAAVGTLTLPLLPALRAGFDETMHNIGTVFSGITSLIGQALTFSANLAGVTGPVGIAHLVGDATTFGFGSILSLAALISINLGVINLFPFPALDGGRLALLAIEAVSGKRVPPKIANVLNTVGFALLILLMLAVTAHDISRLIA
ncbi:site-2 protease family protein [Candidatus Kaiserbacteria bacterium]|nr:site-2 protease family protein [Candidatus Kaiserbacteria bacterium]